MVAPSIRCMLVMRVFVMNTYNSYQLTVLSGCRQVVVVVIHAQYVGFSLGGPLKIGFPDVYLIFNIFNQVDIS